MRRESGVDSLYASCFARFEPTEHEARDRLLHIALERTDGFPSAHKLKSVDARSFHEEVSCTTGPEACGRESTPFAARVWPRFP
jgi:hypothetical protein